MFPSIEKAVLKTLYYADIFDYPLTLNEIWRWLIKLKINPPAGGEKLKITIKNSKLIQEKDGFYFLKGRDKIVSLRKKKELYSKEKLKIAEKVATILKLIPTVKLVGVTGALSVDNTKENDDIDLLIITSRGFLWTTRFLTTILVELTGRRRRPADIVVKDKICLNMFVDEDHLEVQKDERDLFSAHEVLQMKPLFSRDNTYEKFLVANQWVKKYLPNAYREITSVRSGKDTSDGGEATTSTPPRWRNQVKITELFLKRFQLWYMRNRRSSEIIKDGVIRFHPEDAREWVMREYRHRIKKYLS